MTDPLLEPARESPSKPRPSVSRAVHLYKSAMRCIPAVVTNVNEDGSVNLFVMDESLSAPHYLFKVKEGKRMGQWHFPEGA